MTAAEEFRDECERDNEWRGCLMRWALHEMIIRGLPLEGPEDAPVRVEFRQVLAAMVRGPRDCN